MKKDEVSNAVERALSRIDDNASAEEILKRGFESFIFIRLRVNFYSKQIC